MIDSIGGVVIFVSNQARAIEFYTQKLGFDIKGEYPYKNTKWVEVAPKNSTTTISLMEPHSDMMTNEEIEQAKIEIGRIARKRSKYYRTKKTRLGRNNVSDQRSR